MLLCRPEHPHPIALLVSLRIIKVNNVFYNISVLGNNPSPY